MSTWDAWQGKEYLGPRYSYETLTIFTCSKLTALSTGRCASEKSCWIIFPSFEQETRTLSFNHWKSAVNTQWGWGKVYKITVVLGYHNVEYYSENIRKRCQPEARFTNNFWMVLNIFSKGHHSYMLKIRIEYVHRLNIEYWPLKIGQQFEHNYLLYF